MKKFIIIVFLLSFNFCHSAVSAGEETQQTQELDSIPELPRFSSKEYFFQDFHVNNNYPIHGYSSADFERLRDEIKKLVGYALGKYAEILDADLEGHAINSQDESTLNQFRDLITTSSLACQRIIPLAERENCIDRIKTVIFAHYCEQLK